MKKKVPAKISPREQTFVAEFVKHGSPKAAALAIDNSYCQSSPSKAAYKMMQKPVVQAELEKVRNSVTKTAVYNLENAVIELDDKIQRAQNANQFSAVAKLEELKLKVHGLLVEKLEVRTSNFHISVDLSDDHPPIDITAKFAEEDESEDVFS